MTSCLLLSQSRISVAQIFLPKCNLFNSREEALKEVQGQNQTKALVPSDWITSFSQCDITSCNWLQTANDIISASTLTCYWRRFSCFFFRVRSARLCHRQPHMTCCPAHILQRDPQNSKTNLHISPHTLQEVTDLMFPDRLYQR